MSNLGDLFDKGLRAFLRPLTPYWEDPAVTGIFINAPEDVWIEIHGTLEQADVQFSTEQLYQAIRHIAQLSGVLISEENPQLHTMLPNGTEISIVLPPISRSGPVMAIHKATSRDRTLDELVEEGVLSRAAGEFLLASLLAQQSMLIVGPPSSGKATLIRALVQYIPANERLVSLEQSTSQVFEHPHILHFALPSEQQGEGISKVSQALLRALSSIRPNRLLIERMGSRSTLEMLQVFRSGYPGSLATARAYQPEHALQRMEAQCLTKHQNLSLPSLRAQLASAFQLAIVCQRSPQGGSSFIADICQLLPLDSFGGYQFLPVFQRAASDSPQEVSDWEPGPMLPTGNIPSHWPSLQRLGFKTIDRAFFHPGNYDRYGDRDETKREPSQAKVGVPLTHSLDLPTKAQTEAEELPGALRMLRELLAKNEDKQESVEPTPVVPSTPSTKTPKATAKAKPDSVSSSFLPATLPPAPAFAPVVPPATPPVAPPSVVVPPVVVPPVAVAPPPKKEEPSPIDPISIDVEESGSSTSMNPAPALTAPHSNDAEDLSQLNKSHPLGVAGDALEYMNHVDDVDDVVDVDDLDVIASFDDTARQTAPPKQTVTTTPVQLDEFSNDSDEIAAVESSFSISAHELVDSPFHQPDPPTAVRRSDSHAPSPSQDQAATMIAQVDPSVSVRPELLHTDWDNEPTHNPMAQANKAVPPSNLANPTVMRPAAVRGGGEDTSQILDLSDMIADELPGLVSDEEFRLIEQELRQQSPVRQKDPSTDMNLSNHGGPSTRGGMLPADEIPTSSGANAYLYTDEEPTQTGAGLQGTPNPHPPAVRSNAAAAVGPRQNPPHNPARSVVVRRGRRSQVYDVGSFDVQETESTSIRARPPSVPKASRASAPESASQRNQHPPSVEIPLGNNLATEATVIRGRPVAPKKK